MCSWASIATLILLISSGLDSSNARQSRGPHRQSRGNYGRGYIPDHHSMNRNQQSGSDAHESSSSGVKPKATMADVQAYYAENYKNVILKAISTSKLDESPQFIQTVEHCEDILRSACLHLVPEDCRKVYIRCLTNNNSLLNVLTKVIGESLSLICKPLRTRYMKMFQPAAGGYRHFRTYPAFLEYLKAQPKDYSTIVSQLGNAMLPVMIKYVMTPLLPLQELLTAMNSEMLIQQPGSQIFQQNNPGCLTLQMTHSVEVLIDLFIKDPSLTDILLPGFAYFNTVSKYTSGNTFGMTVVLETLRMFVGSASGFACNSQDSFGVDSGDQFSGHSSGGNLLGDHFGGGQFFHSQYAESRNGGPAFEGQYSRKRQKRAMRGGLSGGNFGDGGKGSDTENCDDFGKNVPSGFPVPVTLDSLDMSSLSGPNCNSQPPPAGLSRSGNFTDEGDDDEPNHVGIADEWAKEEVPEAEDVTEEPKTDEEPTPGSVDEEPKAEESTAEKEEKEESGTDPIAAETQDESVARKRRKSGAGQASQNI